MQPIYQQQGYMMQPGYSQQTLNISGHPTQEVVIQGTFQQQIPTNPPQYQQQ